MICARVLSLFFVFFFLMIRRPPRSTQSRSSAASDVYKRQHRNGRHELTSCGCFLHSLSLIHISEPTRLGMISYAVFCLKKKKKNQIKKTPLRTHMTKNNLDNIKMQKK